MLIGKRLYQGRSAELAAMAEITNRGYNVADYTVEVGADFLVTQHRTTAQWRVEVKSTGAVWHVPTRTWWCSIPLRANQILDDDLPELYYIFAPRFERGWEFIIISRRELISRLPPHLSTPRPWQSVALKFILTDSTLVGPNHIDYQPYRNHWDRYWPRVDDAYP